MPDIKPSQSNRSFSNENDKKKQLTLSESFKDNIKKKDLFGIDGYYVPNSTYLQIPSRSFKLVKKEKPEKNFLDYETKRREFIPPPG